MNVSGRANAGEIAEQFSVDVQDAQVPYYIKGAQTTPFLRIPALTAYLHPVGKCGLVTQSAF